MSNAMEVDPAPKVAAASASSSSASSSSATAAPAYPNPRASPTNPRASPVNPRASPTSAADEIDEKTAAAVEAEAAEALKAMEAEGGGGGGGADDDGGGVDGDGKQPKKKRQRTGGRGKKGKAAPTGDEAEANLKAMMARLDLLLKRTEQRAAETSGAGDAASSSAASASSASSSSASGSRSRKGKVGRHRMAEKEEDEKMVADELKEDRSGGRVALTSPPSILSFPPGKGMRAYQLEALNWLANMYERNLNGILADEMGLGKTLEAISLLAFLKEFRKISGPHLIIVPKSTISNWKRELNRWCPALTAFIFHGAKEQRPALREELHKHDVCITTYEMAIIEAAPLKRMEWVYLFIDEAHRIKNENSILSKVVRLFDSRRRLLITGTPLQNNLRELWALLNFLMPDLFDSSEDFESWFEQAGGQDQRNQMVGRLHKILKPFLLRRMKVDVEKALPPKIETKLFVGLSEMQLKWYTDILSKNLDALNAAGGPKMRLLNIIMQIRKVCNHPYLFDGAELGPPYIEGEHLIENSGKMMLLDKLLRRLQERGSRVLIFSQMTRLLDILEDYCLYRGYLYNRIDGSTSQADRDNAMDEFNAPQSEKFIFLLSTRAGGLGINLQTADTVILYDSDWNPQMDLQAMDRAHRIGQTKQVNVYRFVTADTPEEKIIEKATRKLFLDALVIKQGRLADQEVKLGSDELQQMIRFGANQIFQTKNSTITDDDIEAILKRGEERTAADNEKIKADYNDTKTFDFDKAFADTAPFVDREAVIGKPADAKQEIEFVVVPKRERKKTFTESEYWRNALKQASGTNKKPKGVFRPNLRPDYQFFNNERLQELEQKEFEAKHKMRILKDAEKAREKEEKLKKNAELREEKRKAKKREAKAGSASSASTADPATAAAPSAAASASSGAAPMDTSASTVPKPSPSPSPSPSPVADLMKSEKNEKSAPPAASTSTATAPAAAKPDGDADMADDGDGDGAGDDSDADGDDPNASTASASGSGSRGRKSARVIAAAQSEDEKRAAEERAEAMEKEAGCLTAEEVSEKERLEREGFADWTRRHFQSFIRACEQYGRKKIDSISKAVEGKTPEEVKRYYHVFWKKYADIKDSERYLKTIEKGEARLLKVLGLQKTLERKVAPLKKPLEVMDIPYSGQQKTFTPEEDRFIIVTVAAEGYGNWGNLQLAIRASPQFRFDWFMRSRSAADLQRRCDYLIRLLDKENESGAGGRGGTGNSRKKKADAADGESDKPKKEKPKKSRAKGSAAAAADEEDGGGDDAKEPPKKSKGGKKGKAAAASPPAADSDDESQPLGDKQSASAKKGKKSKTAAAEDDAPPPKANGVGRKRKAKADPDE